MYINPFVAGIILGVIGTIVAEIIAISIYAVRQNKKNRK